MCLSKPIEREVNKIEEFIHFINPSECRDMTELFKGRGVASIKIYGDLHYISCSRLIETNIPNSKLKDSIRVLNDFGYTICKTPDVLKKYINIKG